MKLPNDKTFKFSINPKLFDKVDPEHKYHFASGFQSYEEDIEIFEKSVMSGMAFSFQFTDEIRNIGNFLSADFLAVDMDGSKTIEECLDHSIVKEYGSLLYTTVNHSPDHHRFRLVFVLSKTVTDAIELHAAASSLARRLSGDPSATDAARMFFGSSQGQSMLLGNQMTDEYLDELIADGQNVPTYESEANKTPINTKSALKLKPDLMLTTSKGQTISVGDIEDKTSIFCPFHTDKKPSAFVNLNAKGSTYLWCATCLRTWWMEQNGPSKEFNGFETTVRKIQAGEFKKDTLTPIEEFAGLDAVSSKNIHISEEKYISLSKLEDGLTLIKSPKGSGKTTFLAKALQGEMKTAATLDMMSAPSFEEFEERSFNHEDERTYNGKRVLLIGHRQALIGDLCKRLGLNSYLEDKEYSQQEQTHRKARYGVCLDSLWKVDSDAYDIIVMDEVEQVLGHFLSSTMKSRDKTFRTFCNLIKKAKKIVALDADLGWVTFNTLQSIITETDIDPETNKKKLPNKILPIHVYINGWKQDDRSINVFKNDKQLIHHMKTSILDGKRLFITSNSKKKINEIDKIVKNLGDNSHSFYIIL